MAGDFIIRNGLADPQAIAQLQRPLELDLESLFRAMEEDAITGFLRAVEQGQTPTQAISLIVHAISEHMEVPE